MLLRSVGKLLPDYNFPETNTLPTQHHQNVNFCVFTGPCLFVLAIEPDDVGKFSMENNSVATCCAHADLRLVYCLLDILAAIEHYIIE